MKLFRSLILVVLLAPAAWAYVVDTDDSDIYVMTWNPGNLPMLIKLPVSTSPTFTDGTQYTTSIQAAMQTWNAQLGVVQFTWQIVDTPINPPSGTYSTTSGNTLNEIVMDSTYGGISFGERTLAVTTTYTRGNTRVQSDMVFNSDPITRDQNDNVVHLTWDSYRGARGPHWPAVDIRRVAIHELGHTIGLNHPPDPLPGQQPVAIMNSSISDLDTLQADDISGSHLLYAAPGFVPANNNFADATAIVLSSSSTQLTGTNVAATKQSGEPAHAGSTAPTGHSVWWKWTAPGSGSTTITTLGSNFDTALAVYTGTSVSALVVVASNDDVQSGVIRTSTVTFNAIGGTTYFIAVDGFARIADGDQFTPTGAITLNLSYAGPLGGNIAPTITTQPVSQTVVAGSPVTFSAAASGTPVPTFQWQKNGAAISGATDSSYTIPTTNVASAGSYTVVATNPGGSATSNVAVLTVAPPVIAPGNAVITITVE